MPAVPASAPASATEVTSQLPLQQSALSEQAPATSTQASGPQMPSAVLQLPLQQSPSLAQVAPSRRHWLPLHTRAPVSSGKHSPVQH